MARDVREREKEKEKTQEINDTVSGRCVTLSPTHHTYFSDPFAYFAFGV